jgi:hypothetical protein
MPTDEYYNIERYLEGSRVEQLKDDMILFEVLRGTLAYITYTSRYKLVRHSLAVRHWHSTMT